MNLLIKTLAVLLSIWAVLVAIEFSGMVSLATSAPQEASAAGMAVAAVAIPYVFLRALEIAHGRDEEPKSHRAAKLDSDS